MLYQRRINFLKQWFFLIAQTLLVSVIVPAAQNSFTQRRTESDDDTILIFSRSALIKSKINDP